MAIEAGFTVSDQTELTVCVAIATDTQYNMSMIFIK